MKGRPAAGRVFAVRFEPFVKAARGLRRFTASAHPLYGGWPAAPVTTGDLCTRSRPPRRGGPGEQFRTTRPLYMDLPATAELPAATPSPGCNTDGGGAVVRGRFPAADSGGGPPTSGRASARLRVAAPRAFDGRCHGQPVVQAWTAPLSTPDRSRAESARTPTGSKRRTRGRPCPGTAETGTTRTSIEREGGGIPADRRSRAPDAGWAVEQRGQCRPRLW